MEPDLLSMNPDHTITKFGILAMSLNSSVPQFSHL